MESDPEDLSLEEMESFKVQIDFIKLARAEADTVEIFPYNPNTLQISKTTLKG